ncbi:hypothetical protein PR048_007564 [Dryococelus australis]|uniref:Uncharacterized protein n=1 Tax=Dryococelus australis TaxID=614101 RepID=A0ABQ9HUK3_9NEOP|nr:hypothetical protein PR048_007564 [Dryococelus australis]
MQDVVVNLAVPERSNVNIRRQDRDNDIYRTGKGEGCACQTGVTCAIKRTLAIHCRRREWRNAGRCEFGVFRCLRLPRRRTGSRKCPLTKSKVGGNATIRDLAVNCGSNRSHSVGTSARQDLLYLLISRRKMCLAHNLVQGRHLSCKFGTRLASCRAGFLRTRVIAACLAELIHQHARCPLLLAVPVFAKPNHGLHVCRRRLRPLSYWSVKVEVNQLPVEHCTRLCNRHEGNTARLARRSDEALEFLVSVARIALSLLDLGRAAASHSLTRLLTWDRPSERIRVYILNDCRRVSTTHHVEGRLQCYRHPTALSAEIADGDPCRTPRQLSLMAMVSPEHMNRRYTLDPAACGNPSAYVTSEVRCPIPVSLLASYQGDPGSIPGRVTPDFRMWEPCRTMTLVGGSSRRSPVSPAISFRCCSILASITLIGSQDFDVKSHPDLFTHSLTASRSIRSGNITVMQPADQGAISPTRQVSQIQLPMSVVTSAVYASRIPHVSVGWNGDIWAALNIEVLRSDESEAREEYGAAFQEMQARVTREIPEKTRRPGASPGTIPTREKSGVKRPGIETGSPCWEKSLHVLYSGLSTRDSIGRQLVDNKRRRVCLSGIARTNGTKRDVQSRYVSLIRRRIPHVYTSRITYVTLDLQDGTV